MRDQDETEGCEMPIARASDATPPAALIARSSPASRMVHPTSSPAVHQCLLIGLTIQNWNYSSAKSVT
jgi:hypothetical protein